MIEIIGIKKNDLTGDEHFQFNAEVIGVINRFGADSLKIASQFEAFTAAHKLADDALRKISKSSFTEDVKQADKRRDTILRGMRDKLKSAQNHFDTEVQKAASNVKIVFDTYGNMATLPLYQQTSAVFNFLQELRGRYAADTQKTELDKWTDQLEEANNEVARLMGDRRDETVDKQTEATFKQARKMVDATFNEITKRINALVIVEGDENYKEFITQMNVLITDFKNRLNQRKGKNAAKK